MILAKRSEIVKIDKIVPSARNARTHSKEQIAQIRASFREFGVVAPLVVDEKYNLLVGHGRLVAARAEGLTELNCIVVEHLTEAQKRAYIIADNRLALNAGWDAEMLSIELADLQGADFDLSLLGFDDAELSKLMGGLEDVKDDDFDVDKAISEPPFALTGDLWTLGQHRILIGDATKAEDVSRLMDGKRANLLLTDPPYGVSYEGKAGKIANDDLRGEALYQFLLAAFTAAEAALDNEGSAYVFHADTEGEIFRRAFREAGFKLSGTCVWVKPSLVLGRSPYQWRHEPCQPAGTMVLTVDGEKPIEELTDSDRVVSFDTYSGQIKGFRNGGYAITTASRPYQGKMYTVRVGGKNTRTTDNHKFTIRYNPMTKHKYCSYLMKRDGWWRIGVTRTYNSRGFGLKERLRGEKAEAVWLLKTYDNAERARADEQLFSVKYGIPQTHWETENWRSSCGTRTLSDIEYIYTSLDLEKLNQNAHELLLKCDRNPKYPLITIAERESKMSSRVTAKVCACNLIPEIMQIPISRDYTDNKHFQWETIETVETSPFHGTVYSLDVKEYGHYIADGIVVHNCLFGWKKSGKHLWYSDRKQTTIWNFDKSAKNDIHCTMKPVPLLAYPIKNSSTANNIVLDLFSGSFSTGMACEQSNRICYAMEIDTKYASASIKRFHESFPNQAITFERKGKRLTFEEVRSILKPSN